MDDTTTMEPSNLQINKSTSKHLTPLGFETVKTHIKTKDQLWLDSKLRLENLSKRIKNIIRTFKNNSDIITEIQ